MLSHNFCDPLLNHERCYFQTLSLFRIGVNSNVFVNVQNICVHFLMLYPPPPTPTPHLSCCHATTETFGAKVSAMVSFSDYKITG